MKMYKAAQYNLL